MKNAINSIAFLILIVFIPIYPTPAFAMDPSNNILYLKNDINIDELTQQETWVLKQICNGKVADLAEKYNRDSSSTTEIVWDERQQLSSSFIRKILSLTSNNDTIECKTIHIRGAWINKPLNIYGIETEQELIIEDSRFDEDVTLENIDPSRRFNNYWNNFFMDWKRY